MQLPRGTFREIKKGKKAGDILQDLENSRFSGICNFSFKDVFCTLVMSLGKCILAKYGTAKGDAAMNQLQMMLDEDTDVALSDLDDAQIQLSLEFNKSARILKPVPVSRVPHTLKEKPGHPAHHPSAESTHARAHPGPHPVSPVYSSVSGNDTTVTVRKHMPADQDSRIKNNAPEIPKHLMNTGTEAPQEKDIDTLELLDLDQVTDRIRDDCRTMIRQLHLEHLMER